MFTLVAAAYSAVCFVVPVWLRDVATVMQIGTVRLAGRYQAVPVLLLTSALLVLADHFARQGSTRTLRHSTWKTKSPQALPRSVVPARSVARDGMRGSINSKLGGGLPGAEPAFIGASVGDRGGPGDRRLPAGSDGPSYAGYRPSLLDREVAVPGGGATGIGFSAAGFGTAAEPTQTQTGG